MIKVLSVDDSALARQIITRMLSEVSGIEITTAINVRIAERKMKDHPPDVLILDLEMPDVDGLTFLKKIMSTTPMPVIICSSQSESGSRKAIQALEAGAVDVIPKPKLHNDLAFREFQCVITDAVRAASITRVKRKVQSLKVAPKLTADAVLPPLPRISKVQLTDKIIVVGASTGGTEALKVFLSAFPDNAPPILVVQHMPRRFTGAFAERLNQSSVITISEAVNNQTAERGHAYIAPGDIHMLLKRTGTRYYIELKEGPLVSRHRPSVDVLFRSAARYGGSNCIGVIMTGMGDDGSNGMLEMKQAGAYNLAQDEKTCVVYGMPKEAVAKGAVDRIVPLEKLARTVVELSGE